MRAFSMIAAIGAASLAPCVAQAAPLTPGSGWANFSFGAAGSSWSQSFDYSSASATVFRVTDAGISGDQFDVTGLGPTSAPALGTVSVNGNYLQAFTDSAYSHGTFLLAPGIYALSGTVTQSPFGSGAFAAARADEVSVVNVAAGTGWQAFSFGGVDSAWGTAFLVSLASAGVVTITDAGQSGDEFFVDNFGATSTATQGHSVGSDYDAALADPFFSHSRLALAAGNYLITGLATTSPFGGGVFAAVRVDLPEPGTLTLLPAAALGLLAARRRSRFADLTRP